VHQRRSLLGIPSMEGLGVWWFVHMLLPPWLSQV